MPSSVMCVLVPYAPSLSVSMSYMFAGPNATEWVWPGCARAGGGGGGEGLADPWSVKFGLDFRGKGDQAF